MSRNQQSKAVLKEKLMILVKLKSYYMITLVLIQPFLMPSVWEKSPIDLDYLKFLLQQSKKNQLFYKIVTSSEIIAILRVSRQSLQHLT